MLQATVILLLATAVQLSHAAHKHPSCEEFSRGVEAFNSSHAVGTWYLLHVRNQPADTIDAYCVKFSAATDQDRKDLSARIGKFLDVKWESLVLKMKIPCAATPRQNSTQDYFLERLAVDGSYRTLQVPPPDAKLDKTDFNRHPMRLKFVEGKYLAMMDCHEHFMFLLDREPHSKELEPALKIILEAYLPEEH